MNRAAGCRKATTARDGEFGKKKMRVGDDQLVGTYRVKLLGYLPTDSRWFLDSAIIPNIQGMLAYNQRLAARQEIEITHAVPGMGS